ncbi:MAG: ribose-5-phosphate isomerase RpiA [Hyphomicrobiales bacterium]|nr:MAG: ribose-5-phosphate isomerase RpiA [Hyphomicrobiales bacterium]
MSEDLKRRSAAAALTEVASGMRVGLGTGSTARHLVDLLGQQVAAGFDVLCIPTSEATAAQARELGIPLTTLEETPELDLTIDGADEIGPGLALIKGAGGALLREKIVAAASARMVVIADKSKVVAELGRFPLSIEVNRFGLRATHILVEQVARAHGAEGAVKLRLQASGEPAVTDGGHLLLDASFGRISNPEALSADLHKVPGVVEHGLFLGLCAKAYVAGPDGIETIEA